METGCERVGFLGLAFKSGTDDLRESPILEVVNAMLSEGREVSAWDPAINAETRVSTQFDYVRHIYPHLEPVVDALPTILSASALKVLDQADVVVVTQATDEIRRAVAARLGKVHIIDLVRLFPEVPNVDGYEGIGW